MVVTRAGRLQELSQGEARRASIVLLKLRILYRSGRAKVQVTGYR